MTSQQDVTQTEKPSDKDLQEIANNLQFFGKVKFDEFKAWAKSCNPKKLKRYRTWSISGSTLHRAARDGAFDVLDLLLKFGDVNVNSLDEYKKTAFHYAACEGHPDIVYVLLEQPGIDLNCKDCDGNTPIHYAAKKGHKLVVKKLKEQT